MQDLQWIDCFIDAFTFKETEYFFHHSQVQASCTNSDIFYDALPWLQRHHSNDINLQVDYLCI